MAMPQVPMQSQYPVYYEVPVVFYPQHTQMPKKISLTEEEEEKYKHYSIDYLDGQKQDKDDKKSFDFIPAEPVVIIDEDNDAPV